MKKWIAIQIVIDKKTIKNSNEIKDLKELIKKAKLHLDLDALIVWADLDKYVGEIIQEICSDLKIETYLWYPILADFPNFVIKANDRVENYHGDRGFGKTGLWKMIDDWREDFVFICPNKNEVINQLLELCKVILGIDLPKKIDDLLINGVSQDLFLKEVENINNMNLQPGVKNFPGIETVNISNICEMQEENLGKYLVNINKSNVEGIVLSWNLLETPLQNLIFIGDFLGR